MNRYEMRDLDDVRTFLAQGVCLQRAMSVEPATVRNALVWAHELLSQGHPLPPIGFVADVGHIALGLDWENRAGRQKQHFPGELVHLLPSYEDYVLGKIYADRNFSDGAEALRRYREGRPRARGIAFILEQIRAHAGFDGVEFSPGILNSLRSEPPENVIRQGLESLENEGLHPYLAVLYESLINATRRLNEVLLREDLEELRTGTALDEEGDRLAFRQVAQAVRLLENSLPRHRVRPLERRREVPTRVLDEDAYPVGGFSSLSNRGSVESLLHSQLAYIDEREKPDLFDIKYLRDELLYYSRDENQFLRRRRSFVFAFYPDLIERIHFKDAEAPFQRGVLLLALLVVIVRKLSEWLSTDALVFDFLFVVPEGRPCKFDLKKEYELLTRLLRDHAAVGTVVFHFLFLSPSGKTGPGRNELEELKRGLRETLAQGQVEFKEVASEGAVQALCAERARRSLCHCLAISTARRELEAPDVVFTPLRIDGAAPMLGAVAEGDDAMDQWAGALRQGLGRWM